MIGMMAICVVLIFAFDFIFLFRGGVDVAALNLSNVLLILYPVCDLASLILAAFMAYRILTNKNYFRKDALFFCMGIAVNAFADIIYAFGVYNNTFFVAGWNDLLFLIAFFLMSYGIVSYEE
jgi:hypothetical protein